MKKTIPFLSTAVVLIAGGLPFVLTAAPAKPKTAAASRQDVKLPESPEPKAALEEPVIPVASSRDYNGMILKLVKRMPAGGGYSAGTGATAKLVEATAVQKDKSGLPSIRPQIAQPSYCSGATYLVFLSLVDQLIKDKQLKLSEDDRTALEVRRQLDGAGVWGRWNANGPGTGKFFHDLGLGSNFPGLDQARPGDFLKLWWNDHVGKSERGHSVIYLGRAKTPDGEPGVLIWSSNEPDGMGEKVIPEKKIHRSLVSRLEHPENLAKLASMAPKDAFLAGMLDRDCPDAEYMKTLGLKSAGANPSAGKDAKEGKEAKEGATKIDVVIEQGDEAPPAPARADADPPAPAAVPEGAKGDPVAVLFSGSPYAGYGERSRTAIMQMVRMRLQYEGFLPLTQNAATINPQLPAALRAWQTGQGLEATGTLNDLTLKKIGMDRLPEMKAEGPRPAAEPEVKTARQAPPAPRKPKNGK